MYERGKEILFRYGKSMADVLEIKRLFFEENDILLNNVQLAEQLYCKQPRREVCKLCGFEVPTNIYFQSHNIDYCLCGQCGHLNGLHDDGPAFSDTIYRQSEFSNIIYKEDSKEGYFKRVSSIYMPKVKFLCDSFEALDISYKEFRYLDIGAGSGYMVAALKHHGILSTGVELSEQQVSYGNRMLGTDMLISKNAIDIIATVRDTDCEVVCFIHVLEHLNDLQAMLEYISSNKKIKYVYFAVPLFSLACIFEIIFPEVFNRQLGWTHTHLFSKQSLEWMYAKYDFNPLAIWDFGSDIMDLYRSIMIMLDKNGVNLDMINKASDFFRQNTDEMQLVVDKSGFASETHVLMRVHD